MVNTSASSTAAAGKQHRQTRVNPTRTSKTNARPLFFGRNYAMSAVPEPEPDIATQSRGPGFYPGITHFSDAITALPRGIIRHLSLLKEVDAKSYNYEEQLPALVTEALNLKQTSSPSFRFAPVFDDSTVTTPSSLAAADGQPVNRDTSVAVSVNGQQLPFNQQRQATFLSIQQVMLQMLTTLDEKNHVLSNANEALAKHLGRLDEIIPHIEDEICEEARLGSMTHWAYLDKNAMKAAATTSNEGRRHTGRTHHSPTKDAHENEAVARSETRREALARKHKTTHGDSDFDAHPTHTRRTGTGKGRKTADSSTANGHTTPAKRRRLEKSANAQVEPPQNLRGSSVHNAANTAETGSGSQAGITISDAGKRKPRNSAGVGRRRNGANVSGTGSPHLTSSPVIGTFPPTKASPALPPPQRPASSRARKNSVQSLGSDLRQRPTSQASNKPANALGIITTSGANNIDLQPPNDVRLFSNDIAETVNVLRDRENGDLTTDLDASSVRHTLGRLGSHTPKVEPMDSSMASDFPIADGNIDGLATSVTATPTVRSAGSGRQSKTSMPATPKMSESNAKIGGTPGANRSARRNSTRDAVPPPTKRSHKKGASITGQQQRLTRVGDRTSASRESVVKDEADDDDDEQDAEPDNETKYCYCQRVSYGDMIGCDGENCQIEWFHLDCVGLAKAPKQNVKWYCKDCLPKYTKK